MKQTTRRHREPRKTNQVVATICSRIERGMYSLRRFPSERLLAEELDLARVTVRAALRRLIADGFLVQRRNRRLEVNERGSAARHAVSYLAPGGMSPFGERLRAAMVAAASARGVALHHIDFQRWDDPGVLEAVRGMDGFIIGHPAEPMPEQLASAIARRMVPALSIQYDLTAFGIPLLEINPPASLSLLTAHLAGLGHRRIDCINTQPHNAGIAERLRAWRAACEADGMSCVIHDHPVASFGSPMQQARIACVEMLRARALSGSAIFAATELAAHGIARALHDEGLVPGRDISLCTLGGDGMCRFVHPSITCLEDPELTPWFEEFFGWVDRGGDAGIPMRQAAPDSLFIGESTAAPAPMASS